jgi:hypothetical protein
MTASPHIPRGHHLRPAEIAIVAGERGAQKM